MRDVVDVLIGRAATVHRPSPAADDDAAASAPQTRDGILVLTPGRELKGFRTVDDLKRLSAKAAARDKATTLS